MPAASRPELRLSAGTKIAVAFIPVVLVSLLWGLFAFSKVSELEDAVRRQEHSGEVIEQLNALVGAVIDQETGLRGYLLSAEPKDLQPYTNGVKSYDELHARLARLVSDNPAQEERLRKLDDIARTWQRDWAEPQIQRMVRPEAQADARTLVTSGVGRAKMDALRSAGAEMVAAERSLLATRSIAQATAFREVEIAWIAKVLAMIVTSGVGGWLLNRSFAAPLARAASLTRLGSGDLQFVDENRDRNDELGDIARAFDRVRLLESDLRKSERRARAQLAELVSLYQTAPVGLCVLDTSFRYVRINEKLSDINGVAVAAHIGLTVREVVPDLSASIEPVFRRVMETGEPVTDFELQGETPKYPGVMRHWIEHWYPVKDSDGVIVAVGVIVQEISERKRIEAALRASEARLRAVLDACPDEIMLVSTAGIVLATNEAAERRMTRRSGNRDPVGELLVTLLPPDEAEQKIATIGQVVATASVVYRESQVRSRSYECWYFPAFSLDRSVSAVAVYARDVSERDEAFAEVRKLSQAIEHSPSTVFITDKEGTIEYVNPKFTEMTGYTAAEAVGRTPRMLKSGQTPSEHYAELWSTLRSGSVWRGELLNKRKNGENYWESASIAPVKDGETITNFVAVMEDVTVQREREEQLRRAQRMEAVGQLTGGIAHDFNNLLAIVMGNLQLLEGITGDHAEAREYLEDALWATTRGGELTRRLLAFARKQPLKPTVVDLNEVVGGMGEMLRRTLGATIEIEEKLAPKLWKAVVDARELEQVLINLALNSRDAMPNGGALLLATRNVQLEQEYAAQYQEVTAGDYAMVEIVDTGTGMSPQILAQAFEPFFTTKEVGKGSGLGLSMVYGFAKQSRGHVSIYSHVGRGTSVKLYLPRVPSVSREVAETPAEVSTTGLARKVVLVVEDEAKLRKVAVTMLRRSGVESLQADNARSALDLLAWTRVDVLFTDIELPGGMNGIDLAEAARRLYPDIKVLFTTGYTRESVQGGRLLRERAPWLIKPYSRTELADALQELLVPPPGDSDG